MLVNYFALLTCATTFFLLLCLQKPYGDSPVLDYNRASEFALHYGLPFWSLLEGVLSVDHLKVNLML